MFNVLLVAEPLSRGAPITREGRLLSPHEAGELVFFSLLIRRFSVDPQGRRGVDVVVNASVEEENASTLLAVSLLRLFFEARVF